MSSNPKPIGSSQESFWQRTLRSFAGVRVRVSLRDRHALIGRWTELGFAAGVLTSEAGRPVRIEFAAILGCEPEPEPER